MQYYFDLRLQTWQTLANHKTPAQTLLITGDYTHQLQTQEKTSLELKVIIIVITRQFLLHLIKRQSISSDYEGLKSSRY